MSHARRSPPTAPTSRPPALRTSAIVVLTWAGCGFATLIAFAILVLPTIPLGLPGEWVWNRSQQPPSLLLSWGLTVAGLIPLLTLAYVGSRWLERPRTSKVVLLLPALLALAALWQTALVHLPSDGYGPERWPMSVYYPATSGYFTVARSIDDVGGFLRGYDDWLRDADSFHLGTHPPGLIVITRAILDLLEKKPKACELIDQIAFDRMKAGVDSIDESLRPAERATLLAIPLLTWLASLLTILPIYALARLGGSAQLAWWSSCFWAVAPASVLFVPVWDTFFPLLAMTSLWFVLAGYHYRVAALSLLGGLCLAGGMMLSLAFVVVGAIAGLAVVLLTVGEGRWGRGMWVLLVTAAGFALPSEILSHLDLLNMPTVWSINLAKHAGFYQAMPRSFAPWLVINLIEFAIVAGPALALAALAHTASRSWRSVATPVDRILLAGLVVLLLLNLSGRNRSEAARLWLFMTPLVPVGAARFTQQSTAVNLVGAILTALVAVAAVGWVEPLLPILPVASRDTP